MGFSNHATTTFRNNRALLSKRKGALDVLNDLSIWHKAPKYKFKEATPELLERIREHKIEEERERIRKSRRLLTICSLAMVIAFYFIYKSIML